MRLRSIFFKKPSDPDNNVITPNSPSPSYIQVDLQNTKTSIKEDMARKKLDLDRVAKITAIEDSISTKRFEADVIQIKLALIDERFADPELNNEKLCNKFRRELKKLEDEYAKGEKERLGSRPDIYLNGKTIPMTPELKTELLTNYLANLQSDMKLQLEIFGVELETKELGTILKILKESLTILKETLEEEADKKIQLLDEGLEVVMELEKLEEEKLQTLEETAKAIAEELPEIVATGNIENVRKKIDAVNFLARKSFVNQVGPDGLTALQKACLVGNKDMVSLLLAKGARVNVKSSEIAEDGGNYFTLHYAVRNSDHVNTEAIIKSLLEAGANINARGNYKRTALHSAVFFCNVTAVKVLLENKASVDAREEGSAGNTPLHNAVMKGSIEIIELLGKYAAAPVTNNNDELPVYTALLYNQIDAAKKLLTLNYTVFELPEKVLIDLTEIDPADEKKFREAQHILNSYRAVLLQIQAKNNKEGKSLRKAIVLCASVMPKMEPTEIKYTEMPPKQDSSDLPSVQGGAKNKAQYASSLFTKNSSQASYHSPMPDVKDAYTSATMLDENEDGYTSVGKSKINQIGKYFEVEPVIQSSQDTKEEESSSDEVWDDIDLGDKEESLRTKKK